MDDLEQFRETVRATLEARLEPRRLHAPTALFGAGTDTLEAGRAFLEAMAETGYMTPTWPKEYGGLGLANTHASIIRRELSSFDVPDLYPFGVSLGIAAPTLIDVGTDEQKRRLLAPIARGYHIWCQLLSEPDAGSDLASVSTRAIGDGSTWRLTGRKVWSSRAQFSDYGLCLTRTDSSLPKHAGLTVFAVPLRQEGVTVRPLRQINGDEHFNEVFLDDALVDDRDRIGAEGEGWRIAMVSLAHERRGLLVSSSSRPADTAAELVNLARTMQRSDDPCVRQDLARILTLASLNRWTAKRAQQAKRTGSGSGLESSGAKLRAVELEKRIADLALYLLGVEGVAFESSWTTRFLTAPSLSIRGGTDEIQRNIIGEKILGLPPEPRVDADMPYNELHRPRERSSSRIS